MTDPTYVREEITAATTATTINRIFRSMPTAEIAQFASTRWNAAALTKRIAALRKVHLVRRKRK